MKRRVKISNIEYALPSKVLDNAELALLHPDWNMTRMLARTGVERRHVASCGETSLDFAVTAAAQLVESGAVTTEEIDGVIFCTQSPDYPMPGNAHLLHRQMDLRQDVFAFDITLACSGFVYGLGIAQGMLLSGMAEVILLATSDTYTQRLSPDDRATVTLFGDGGAVTVLRATEDDRGIRDISFGSAGSHSDHFIIREGGARQPAKLKNEAPEQTTPSLESYVSMNGMGVLSFFNSVIPKSIQEILSRNELTMDQVDHFVFHQASQIALDSIAKALGIPSNKMIVDIKETGNLVSASVPVALARAMKCGRLRDGQVIVLCGFGVGLSWSCAIIDL